MGRNALMWVAAALLLPFVTDCDDPVQTEVPPPPAVDREFDAGSDIGAQQLTPIQIQNLALLGKVWGFAKYHHWPARSVSTCCGAPKPDPGARSGCSRDPVVLLEE